MGAEIARKLAADNHMYVRLYDEIQPSNQPHVMTHTHTHNYLCNRLVLAARRVELLEQVAHQCRSLGATDVLVYATDVTDRLQCQYVRISLTYTDIMT
jgi:hypothetical protein